MLSSYSILFCKQENLSSLFSIQFPTLSILHFVITEKLPLNMSNQNVSPWEGGRNDPNIVCTYE
jgi:hypothetical protein